MKTLKFIALGAAFLALATACDESHDITGKWTSAAPEKVTEQVADAQSAFVTTTFDFNAPVNGEPGIVTYSADYDVTAPVADADTTKIVKYTVTANIQGTWSRDVDDDDDVLISFDRNTLSVAGNDAPELGPVTDAFLNSLSQFTTISDIEVSKDKAHLTFEVGHPDKKLHFVSK